MENYRLPKHLAEKEEESDKKISQPGHAYQGQDLANEYSLEKGQDLFNPAESTNNRDSSREDEKATKQARKEKRQEKRKRKAAKEAKRARKEERRRRRDERKMRHDSDDEDEDRYRYSKKSRQDD